VHATITDATQSQSDLTLQQAFAKQLPSLALKQAAEIMLLILDRVIEAPSVWLMCLTPIVMWLTLHRDDGLVDALFESSSSDVRVELSRLHSLVENYCR